MMMVGVTLLLAAPAAAGGRATKIAGGEWGGEHVRLVVREAGADVEFDCAHGSLDAALAVDEKGGFDVPGRFTRRSGGPVHKDRPPQSEPVRYRGAVAGDSMTLEVVPADGGESYGSFRLKRAEPGRLVRCY